MEDAQRWSVTYTKHVKQKRKVYQDGFLELQSTRHKVMLYDEWDNLLESRFVKKDDIIKSGETLAFDSYLVDISEICGGHKPKSTYNGQEIDKKIAEKSGSLCSHEARNNSISVDRKPTFGKKKAQVINLSPSQQIIRDFKKSEMNKFGSSPSCPDIKTSKTEWLFLYTAQITQKAKKFHDGFLQLVVRGSHGRQVMLYDTTRRLLDNRFLKKDEIVCSGESLAFQSHLVEIGEQEGDHKPVTELTLQGKNSEVVGKTDIANNQAKISTNKKFPAVHDILSIIRKPIQRKVVAMNESLVEEHVEEHHESHSSDVHSDIKKHIKDYAEECNRNAWATLKENTSGHDCGIKILKSETVEVHIAAEKCKVSENGRESQDKLSRFCHSSGATNCIIPILDVECTDDNKLMSSSSVEPNILVTPALDSEGQRPIESATLTRSNTNEEPENPPEIFSCEGIITETTAAATNGLSSSKLPKLCEEDNQSKSRCLEAASDVGALASNDCTSHDLYHVEEKTLKQVFHKNGMNEFPSFDLGF